MPHSMRRVAENRWTPTAITALVAVLVPVLLTWLTLERDNAAQAAKVEQLERALRDAHERLDAAQVATRLRTGELQDALDKAQAAAQSRILWEDVAWCAVGVRAPSGCTEVELLPRPMRSSRAPPIQIRARDPP